MRDCINSEDESLTLNLVVLTTWFENAVSKFQISNAGI